MKRPKVILLDYGGTLDGDGAHWSIQYADAFAAAGSCLPRDRFREAFLESERAMLARGDAQSLRLEDHVRQQVVQMLDHLHLDRGLCGAICEHFLRRSVACLDRNHRVLRRHLAGFRYGVVSNFTVNLPIILRQTGLADVFESVVVSEIAGVRKPDPAIFRIALDQMGASPSHAAMVGDSLTNDIVPAKALGLRTAWIRSPQVTGEADEAAADYVVSNVAEAIQRLAGEAL